MSNRYTADTALQDGRLRQAQLKMLSMLEVVDKICQKHQLDYWLDAGTLLGAVRHQGFIPWDDDMDISMPRASFERFLQVAPAEVPEHMWIQTAQTDPGFFNTATPLKIRDRHSRFIEKHETGNEPYVQGIFIDVFVYDYLPTHAKLRKRYKFIAKKLSRLLGAKYSTIALGHYAGFYRLVGRLFSKSILENCLQGIIKRSNQHYSDHLGRGYQCIGNNVVAHDDIYPLKRARFETGEFNIANRPEVILQQQYGDYLTLPPEEQRVMRHCIELIPDMFFNKKEIL